MKILSLTAFALAMATTALHGALAELNVAEGTIESPDGGLTYSGRSFTIAKDFKLELLYTVPAEEGQWVPLNWDDKGRLIVGSHNTDQIFRLTIPKIGSNDPVKTESIGVTVGANEGILYAFNSIYFNVNRSSTMRPGIYRITDTNNDDKYDKVSVVRNIQPNGGGGAGGDHGTHDLQLMPDGKRITMISGNETRPTEFQSSRVPMIWGEDNLVKRNQQTGPGFNRAPSAWIATFDPEGKDFELYSMGMRNPVSHHFNKDGEMFVYDSDMEFDKMSSWYRPTNVQHIISGADSGWRDGSRKHPLYYFDYYGTIAPVGSGSPTGASFGTGTKFPARYQDAYFIDDWSYGNLWAVFITPDGSSYKGEAMPFISGSPFPVTGTIVNKADGSLIVQTGARAPSQLFRVTYTGGESTTPTLPDTQFVQARKTRQSLEAFHGKTDPMAVQTAWPYLSDNDRAIRFAARTAIEWQNPESWKDKAIGETDPRKAIAAIASLARVSGRDEFFRPQDYVPADKALEARMISTLEKIELGEISYQDKLDWLRSIGLVFIRMGPPDEATRQRLIAKIDPYVPSRQRELNWEAAEVLIYLQAPSAASKVMGLLRTAPTAPYYPIAEYINPVGRTRGVPGTAGGTTNFSLLKQEDQIHYAELLRTLKTGWTNDLRKEYLEWFVMCGAQYRGDVNFNAGIQIIRSDAVSQMSAQEKEDLKDTLAIPVVFGGGRGGGGGGGAGPGRAGGAGGGAGRGAPGGATNVGGAAAPAPTPALPPGPGQ